MDNSTYSEKALEVIGLLQQGYFLYENKVTPRARWSLTKYEGSYNWGSVHGGVINKILHLMEMVSKNIAVAEWKLTEVGKSIKLNHVNQ